ncbi:MAG TPA: NAD(P)(+) transhydrogenase (Re/Si-specific) subunit beta [Saprospiraceae bacterium]|nr:NAD(P)(+) transhydrogenase (Re/Si-specific) subunit beta [Saprospiraceae bacterium]HNT20168.1 NAD(P)(+) transhydrogenase (Re/Si-specific) subunit beta [Saprospiraceae bacterium]
MELSLLTIIYLVAAVTFILGLKMLSSPASARKGNLIAAFGMVLAILGTIFFYRDEEGKVLHNYLWIFGGLAIGSGAGWVAARKVKMTAMPELVSLFNGMGGACAALISLIEFNHLSHSAGNLSAVSGGTLLIIFLGLIIGSISFAGSVVAWGKLNGRIKDFSFKGQHWINFIILALVVFLVAFILISRPETSGMLFYAVLFLSLLYGFFFVMPIGGADMPVVISLLNSFTGVAAASGGFLYDNKAMLTGGILVGAAGTLLTILMCKAMNRSIFNVLVGNFGGGAAAATGAAAGGARAVKEITASDLAINLNYSKSVVVVPGYGLAVAQAQKTVKELEDVLEANGVEVRYAIHPVAGRMPGHMNVLLAEANVPYPKLVDLEEANEMLAQADVVLVLGANDVVNPAAKDDPTSPIYGMPVLEVWNAKLVVVVKRSMGAGYAGIENPLFFHDRTKMLFGDAKKVLQDLVNEVKAL